MTYTTHGLMTPADRADMRDLYDLDASEDNVERCEDCDENLDDCECDREDNSEEHGWDQHGVNSYEL